MVSGCQASLAQSAATIKDPNPHVPGSNFTDNLQHSIYQHMPFKTTD